MLLLGPKNDVISEKKKGLFRNFRPKSSDLQKKEKKKRSSPKFQRFFRPKSSDPKNKKKVFSAIATVFPAEIKLFACDFHGPFTSQCHLDSWAP